jgi:hypothetical protein
VIRRVRWEKPWMGTKAPLIDSSLFLVSTSSTDAAGLLSTRDGR